MGRRRTAVGTAAIAFVVVVVLVGIVALVLAQSPIDSSTTSSSTGLASSTSSSDASPSRSVTSNSMVWTVLNSNSTVYGDLACLDTVAMLYPISCPPAYPGSKSPSLTNVEIISYRGQVLYDANISIVVNGQPKTYTMWFTNSTIFCVSPSDGYPICPTHPIYVTVVINTASASAVNASTGLRLGLELSNAIGGIDVTVDEYNTLNRVNNVTSASEWAIYSNSLRDICDNQVVSFAVYQGNYGGGNFTTASPLILSSPGSGNICPELSPSVVYSFSPDSGVASAPAGAFGPTLASKNVTLSDSLSGYFTCGENVPSFRPANASGVWICAQDTSKAIPFPLGTYTVVALDQWGDVAVAHFEVYG